MICCIWLKGTNVVTSFEIVSEALLIASAVYRREVLGGAIVSSYAKRIVAHNYPSGNPESSNENRILMNKLIEAVKIIEIIVFDHLSLRTRVL